MLEFILSLCTFIGPFALMESVLHSNTRARISDYIFRKSGSTWETFEASVYEVWIGAFFDRERLRATRMIVFALISVIFCHGIIFLLANPADQPFADSVFSFGMFFGFSKQEWLYMTVVAVPATVANLFISRYIYFSAMPKWNFFWKLFADVLLTGVVLLVSAIVSTQILLSAQTSLNDNLFDMNAYRSIDFSTGLFFGTVYAFFGIILFRLLTFLFAGPARLLVGQPPISEFLENKTNLVNVPLTFIALLFFPFFYLLLA